MGGCEAEYGTVEEPSTLCGLSVLMNRLDELAMPLKKWEPHCAEVTAAYFANDVDEATEIAMTFVGRQHPHDSGLGVWLFCCRCVGGGTVYVAVAKIELFK